MTEATPSRLVDIPLEVCVWTDWRRTRRGRAMQMRWGNFRWPTNCSACHTSHVRARRCSWAWRQVRPLARSRWYLDEELCDPWTGPWGPLCVSRFSDGMWYTAHPAGRRVVDRTQQSRRACMALSHSTKSDWKVVVTMYRHLNQAW